MATDRAAEAHIPQSVPVPAERVRPGNCHHRNAAWTRVEPLSCLRRAGDTQYAGSLSPQGAIPALLRDTTQLVSHVRCVSASEGGEDGRRRLAEVLYSSVFRCLRCRAGQIGSASCRERVCKYVLIPGVAVS